MQAYFYDIMSIMQFDNEKQTFIPNAIDRRLLGDSSEWSIDDAPLLQHAILKARQNWAERGMSDFPQGAQLNTAIADQQRALNIFDGMLGVVRPFVPGGLAEEIEEALRRGSS